MRTEKDESSKIQNFIIEDDEDFQLADDIFV
jgi:hypothetical protein